jgi:hypothetical protein
MFALLSLFLSCCGEIPTTRSQTKTTTTTTATGSVYYSPFTIIIPSSSMFDEGINLIIKTVVT